jgi:hypothetical protein
MFVIECRKCGFYFEADAPDRNICFVCLRDAEQEAMIADLNKCNQAEKHPKGGTSK